MRWNEMKCSDVWSGISVRSIRMGQRQNGHPLSKPMLQQHPHMRHRSASVRMERSCSRQTSQVSVAALSSSGGVGASSARPVQCPHVLLSSCEWLYMFYSAQLFGPAYSCPPFSGLPFSGPPFSAHPCWDQSEQVPYSIGPWNYSWSIPTCVKITLNVNVTDRRTERQTDDILWITALCVA